jgi:hypothetical protein
MFPQNAISTSTSIQGNVSYTLVSTTTPTIVYGVRMQQSGTASETYVHCPILGGGNGNIAYNYAKDYPQDLLAYKCYGNIVVTKTGNDTSFVSITYAPQNYLPLDVVCVTGCAGSVSTTTGTSTTIYSVNGFSYEGILISFLLLVLVTGQFFGGILNRLIGVKSKMRIRLK